MRRDEENDEVDQEIRGPDERFIYEDNRDIVQARRGDRGGNLRKKSSVKHSQLIFFCDEDYGRNRLRNTQIELLCSVFACNLKGPKIHGSTGSNIIFTAWIRKINEITNVKNLERIKDREYVFKKVSRVVEFIESTAIDICLRDQSINHCTDINITEHCLYIKSQSKLNFKTS